MTDRQNAKLNMAQRTLDVLDKNSEGYSGMAPMVDAVNDLRSMIADIREKEKLQGKEVVESATRDKGDAESNMVDLSIETANCIYVAGVNTGNNELQTQAAVNMSTFALLEGNEKLALACRIVDLAYANADALVPFGIAAADIDALRQSTDVYAAVIAKPMGGIAERKQRTTSLAELFPKMTFILTNKIDKMMVRFKRKNPAFYDEYKTARNIINTSARHRNGGNNGDGDTPPTDTQQ